MWNSSLSTSGTTSKIDAFLLCETELPQKLALSWRNAYRGPGRTTGRVAVAGRGTFGRAWTVSAKD